VLASSALMQDWCNVVFLLQWLGRDTSRVQDCVSSTREQMMARLTGPLCTKRGGYTLKRSIVCRQHRTVRIFRYGFGTITRGTEIVGNKSMTYSQIH